MRKTFATALALCLLASPALSLGASWKQVSSNMFVDASSIARSYNARHADVKYTYDKDDAAKLQKTLKSKSPPQHSVQRKNFFCNNRQVSTSSFAYYAADGTALATGSYPNPQKTDIVPGSRIEPVFDFVCQ